MRKRYLGPIVVAGGIGLLHVLTVYTFWRGGEIERFVLIDDAMISMCYARSLAEGCGLVWYCGAPKVEGYTNVGWVLYMALWHWLGIPPECTSLFIFLTGFLTLALHLRGIYLLAESVANPELARLATWIASLFTPLLFHHLSGLEAGFLAMLGTYALYVALRSPAPNLPLTLIAIIGTLVRMDFVLIPLALLVGGALHEAKQNRRISFSLRQKYLFPLLAAVGVVAALSFWRHAYYGSWVPNTYVLKVSSLPFSWRLYNGTVATLMHMGINLPLYLLAALGLWRLRQAPFIEFLLAPIALSFAYNVYVGGDIYEASAQSNRFLLNAFTSLFLLSARGIQSLSSTPWKQALLVGLIAYGLPLGPIGYRWHNFFRDHKEFFFAEVKQLFPLGSPISIGPAGTTPYFLRNYRWHDLLGKNDSVVARRGMLRLCNGRPPLLYFPGHTRIDTHNIRHIEGLVGIGIYSPNKPQSLPWWWTKLVPTPCKKHYTNFFEDTPLQEYLLKNFEEIRPGIWRRKPSSLQR